MYSSLNSDAIVGTIEQLNRRIYERFPDSSLSKLCEELLGLSRNAQKTAERIARPWMAIRAIEFAIIVTMIGGIVWIVAHFGIDSVAFDLPTLVQILEPALNLVVLAGLAIFSIASVEKRVKRARSLVALNELRAIAHIIDMHQLTKDPERPYGRRSTPSSPTVELTGEELRRYLDYCSEMLSLTSKVAALFVAKFDDPIVLSAVNELESLTTGLSRKIWQKIVAQLQLPASAKRD